MAFRLYNSLTKRIEEFRPADPSRITFYSCGPTVYDFAHIGNFRSFLAADVLRRWLESPLCEIETGKTDASGKPEIHRGPREVVHVMNITDVGHMTEDDNVDGGGVDRMEEGGRRILEMKKAGKLPPGAPADLDAKDPYAIAEFYAHAFLEDARLLGLRVAIEAEKKPELMPRPTRKIAQMQAMIRTLLAKGDAYVVGAPGAAGTAVYFDVQKFPEYGRLSGNTLERLRTGAGGRVSAANQAGKRNAADFMLWKVDPSHVMKWEFDGVGAGYPGWHIECSAMAREILGDTIDLHSGGEDNIFPHHECEIAQSCSATGAPTFARHWMHVRHLMVEGEKMSKSKGNFYTIRDLVEKGFEPAAIRLELIKTHYRSNANFTEQGLKDSARRLGRWRRHAASIERYFAEEEKYPSNHGTRSSRSDSYTPEQWQAIVLNGLSDLFGAREQMRKDLTLGGFVAWMDGQSRSETLREEAAAQHASREVDFDAVQYLSETEAHIPEEPLSWEEIASQLSLVNNKWAKQRAAIHAADRVLGVIFRPKAQRFEGPTSMVDSAAESLKARIDAARGAKNYAESDRLRAEAEAAGYEVRMSKDGATVTKRAGL